MQIGISLSLTAPPSKGGGVPPDPSAPVNTIAPAISGTPQQGQTLSVSNGSWSGYPAPTYAYQWKRGGVNISGATSNTYTLVSGDVSANITCTVTATNASGSASATSPAVGPVLPFSPANTVAPVVSGTAQEGQTLSTTDGTWSNSPTGYTYQWIRGASPISGATSSTYLLVTADVGSNISCVVTATNAGGSTAQASNSVGPVTAAATAPVNTVAPVVSYDSAGGYAGSVYTTTNGTWTNSPTGYSRQWYADGVAISGQTGSTWTMTLASEGKAIKCAVTASNAGGSSSAVDSNVIEMWVPTDAGNAPVAIMDIRQGLTMAGSAVSAWASQIGGLSATQGSGANQPVYSATSYSGSPGMSFNGSSTSLGGAGITSGPTARTVLAAIIPSTVSGNKTVFGCSNNGGFQFRLTNAALTVNANQSAGRQNSSGLTLVASSPYLVGCRQTASGPYDFRANGVVYGSGSNQGGGFTSGGNYEIGSVAFGGFDYFGGVLSSQLVADAYWSNADTQKGEGWIAWTLQKASTILDASHPYKSAPPRIQ